MIKILTSLLLLVVLTPSVEANVSRGREPRYRPRCRTNRGVTVCRMPRHKKPRYCGIMPCIPPGYYRPNPPRRVPMR